MRGCWRLTPAELAGRIAEFRTLVAVDEGEGNARLEA